MGLPSSIFFLENIRLSIASIKGDGYQCIDASFFKAGWFIVFFLFSVFFLLTFYHGCH